MGAKVATARNLADSRLWAGVPQLALANIAQYDPAYQGHTFMFVTNTPLFLDATRNSVGGLHMGNLTALIERASTGFSGAGNKTVSFAEQTDGYANRKMQHPTAVIKEIDEITLKMHEFKGLVLKNAIEYWIDGIYDEKSQHASYYGQVEAMEFSIANHTMGVLVVQVDPSWYQIQDAAWYHNMIPVEVPFEHFNWTKGEVNIVEDYDLRFKANEERGPFVTDSAILYMNAKILAVMDQYYDRANYDPRIPVPTA